MSIVEEERGNVWEKTKEKADCVLGFKWRFLGRNGSQVIREAEVRNINFQDLMRNLQHRESVLITTQILEDCFTKPKKKDRGPWYFGYMNLESAKYNL